MSSGKRRFPPLNGKVDKELEEGQDLGLEAADEGQDLGGNENETEFDQNTFSPTPSFVGFQDSSVDEDETKADDSEGLNIDDSSSDDIPEEVILEDEDLTPDELDDVKHVVDDVFTKTEEAWSKNEPTLYEKLTGATGEEVPKTKTQEAVQMFDKADDNKQIKIQGRVITKVKPENYAEKSKVVEKDVKGWNENKFKEALVGEIGKGVSKLSGTINIHVSPDAVKDAIIKIVKASVKEAAGRGIDISAYAERFIKSIRGVVAQTMTSQVGKVSIATFADTVFSIIAEQPKITQEEAKAKAAAIVTSYTGKNIIVLGKDASIVAADVLTLLVDKEIVPDEEDGEYALVVKGFLNEIRYNDADANYVRMTLALDKILPYAQGSFDAAEMKDVKFFSTTLITLNNILSEVVYTVIKEDK